MTTTVAEGPKLTVFPEVTNATVSRYQAPAGPSTPVTDALSGVATKITQAVALDPTKKQFSCVDMLAPEQVEAAKLRATELVDAILENALVGVQYGNRELAPVNNLIRELLASEREVSIPEMEARMKGLRSQLREIEGHAAADPRVQAWYAKWSRRFLEWAHLVKGSWALLRDDVKSMNDHIDDLERMIEAALDELSETIAQYDEYRKRNEAEIVNLFGVVAVMELASLEAAQRATDIVIDEHDPLTRNRERRDELTKVSTDLENRAARMQTRLMMGFATSVDIRGSRDLDAGLAGYLSDLQFITLPSLRATVWKWLKAKKARGYAEKGAAIRDFAVDVQNMYNTASVDTAAVVANVIETPLMTPESILAMATALDQVADVIVAAMQKGVEQRTANRHAITQGLEILGQASDKVAAERMREVLERVQAIEVKDVIPDDFAHKVLAIPTGAGPSTVAVRSH